MDLHIAIQEYCRVLVSRLKVIQFQNVTDLIQDLISILELIDIYEEEVDLVLIFTADN
jgi:hypothetical protein